MAISIPHKQRIMVTGSIYPAKCGPGQFGGKGVDWGRPICCSSGKKKGKEEKGKRGGLFVEWCCDMLDLHNGPAFSPQSHRYEVLKGKVTVYGNKLCLHCRALSTPRFTSNLVPFNKVAGTVLFLIITISCVLVYPNGQHCPTNCSAVLKRPPSLVLSLYLNLMPEE